jgi:lipopolysaccharide export system protein LptA
MIARFFVLSLLGCAGVFGLAAVSHAQSLKLESSDKPIDVTAEKGIELQQDNKRVIARGNAKAVQGEVTILGDELTADYRTRDDGSSEVYRVFAAGNVTMKSATETATGDAAVYDFDKGVLVMEGDDVSLVNPDGSVTAHRLLQYWSNDRVAVAEGSATALDKDKRRLSADKLIAFFRDAEGAPASGAAAAKRSRGDITYIQAFGNVRMETAKEIVRGDRGAYNIDTGIATLDGSVKITQNKNQLGGGFAVVNVKGGTSRLYGSAKEAGMQGLSENTRVKALIAPAAKASSPAPAAASGIGQQ